MDIRTHMLWAALIGVAPFGCASQQTEPQVASSAAQTNYAMDYPAAAQETSNDYQNSDTEVRRVTTDFAKYPDQLKDPPLPIVKDIVNRADEAGRSGAYVDARRELEGTQTFFTQEKDEITRKVAGSAQYVAKKKNCDVDVSGAVSASLKEAIDKQLEKRLRAHNDAHLIIERYRESLGKANAAALEKQADDISGASYITYVRTAETKARASQLLDDANQAKRTLDQSIAEERAFQAESGRTAADKKASSDRVAKMEDAKVKIDQAVPQLQALLKDIDQRNEAMKKEYNEKLDALKQTIDAKTKNKEAPGPAKRASSPAARPSDRVAAQNLSGGAL